jgi:hypothetical protein
MVAAASVAVSGPITGALRPDHIETGQSSTSLVPLFFQPRYLSIPGALSFAFTAAWLWMRRRDQGSTDGTQPAEGMRTATLLAQMDRAAATGDARRFFSTARTAVQHALAARWQVLPESITPEAMDSRLGADRTDICRLFDLANEAAYAGTTPEPIDSQKWRQVVLRQIGEIAPS